MTHPPQVRPEEPIAVTPHDGICGGESQQWLSYPTNPHVRFDERGRETERCRMAQATAPVLDSTMRPFPGEVRARFRYIVQRNSRQQRGWTWTARRVKQTVLLSGSHSTIASN